VVQGLEELKIFLKIKVNITHEASERLPFTFDQLRCPQMQYKSNYSAYKRQQIKGVTIILHHLGNFFTLPIYFSIFQLRRKFYKAHQNIENNNFIHSI
jgi:hypothetical protein